MIKILAFLAPPSDGAKVVAFIGHHGELSLTRVPCVGEIIHFGEDGNGEPMDYRVELVRHFAPGAIGNDLAAEIYGLRVDQAEMVRSLPLPDKRWLGVSRNE